MNSNLLKQLVNWPKYYISGTDLKVILPGTDHSRKAIIKRAVHEGYLVRLKRDYYIINNIANKPSINEFELAQLIYGPSYISFESALSYHGWIPEKVTVICSATIKQTKTFNTPIATFSFEKIPNKVFSLGVTQIKEKKSNYFMANPWKAIADMIYCREKRWDTITDLMGDLRIEVTSIEESSLGLLQQLSNEYPHKPTRQVLKKINTTLGKYQ